MRYMGLSISRNFYPVGQGAFYSETFRSQRKDQLVVVYDCGALNFAEKAISYTELDRAITEFNHQSIDYLVISHFHVDHINGIQRLKDRGIKIANVIIPQLDNDEKIICHLDNLNNDANPDDIAIARQIIFDPEGYFDDAQIIRISREGGEEQRSLPIEETRTGSYGHNTNFGIPTNRGEVDWILRFYVDSGVFSGLTAQQRTVLQDFEASDLDDPTRIEEVKLIYRSLKGNFNLTSMSYYSGPSSKPFWGRPNVEVGILLNGDADLKSKAAIWNIVDHYKDQKEFIGYFGIPHHGSHHNTSDTIDDFPILCAYIQAGFSNRYGHPAGTTLNAYKNKGIQVEQITERSGILFHRFFV